MDIVLYGLAGLALLALVVIGIVASARGRHAAPNEPAVAPDPFERPAAPSPDESIVPPEGAMPLVAEEPVVIDERELEEESIAAPEEGELVPGEPPPTIDALMERIRSGNPASCREAVDLLVERGAEALPALRGALEDPDPDVRIDARKAIERIEAHAS